MDQFITSNQHPEDGPAEGLAEDSRATSQGQIHEFEGGDLVNRAQVAERVLAGPVKEGQESEQPSSSQSFIKMGYIQEQLNMIQEQLRRHDELKSQ